MKFTSAHDVYNEVREIAEILELKHILVDNIICFRSAGSKSKAVARIWSLPRIWQLALDTKPHYIIEVLSERFDKLSKEEQTKTLIHELLHIPKTFSGALVPHKCFGKRIDRKKVDAMYLDYEKKKEIGGLFPLFC